METTVLIVRDAAGVTVEVAACNEKSRTKSLERGELWVVTRDTGRVLPFRGGGARYTRFVEGDHWFEVELADAPADGVIAGDGSGRPAPRTEAPSDGGAAASQRGPVAADSTGDGVLDRLGDLIAERHRTMPEGSYTTHLFSSGSGKIRKKVGEEAVEVILAATSEELRSEAADLVYHLMVLLEAEGMRFAQVVEELAFRHRGE